MEQNIRNIGHHARRTEMKVIARCLPLLLIAISAAFVCADDAKPEAPKTESTALKPVEETRSGTLAKSAGADGVVAVLNGDAKHRKDGGEVKPKKAAKLGLKTDSLNLSADGEVAAKLAELASKSAHADVTGVITNGTMKVTKVSESKVADAGGENMKKKKKKDKNAN
jgi:hypothetical protein